MRIQDKVRKMKEYHKVNQSSCPSRANRCGRGSGRNRNAGEGVRVLKENKEKAKPAK